MNDYITIEVSLLCTIDNSVDAYQSKVNEKQNSPSKQKLTSHCIKIGSGHITCHIGYRNFHSLRAGKRKTIT
uniref:Uncharacterized protein n=1 Tax=Rhizophora mucronata TaxID=61149 RepID=A0A2P2N5I4_RHIMU